MREGTAEVRKNRNVGMHVFATEFWNGNPNASSQGVYLIILFTQSLTFSHGLLCFFLYLSMASTA